MFRYAIAILKYFEESLLKQSDYMSIFHTLRDGLSDLKDVQKLTQVSYSNFAILSLKVILIKMN